MKKQFQSKSVPRGTRTIWRYLGALFILFTFAIGNVWADTTIVLADVTPSSNWYEVTGVGRVTNKKGSAFDTGDYNCTGTGYKTGSSYFTVQTYKAITGLQILATSTSNRTLAGIAIGDAAATSKPSSFPSGASGSGSVKKNTCDQVLTINFGTTVAANKYISIGLSGNTNIFAVTFIEAAVTKHSVTYVLNGATGTTPTQADVAENAKFTLHDGTTSITAPSGKEFAGWNDGSKTYAGGAEYTMGTSNVTLTAQWQDPAPKYSVTYVLNGPSGDAPTQAAVAAGTEITLAAAPSWAGHAFDGWKCNIDNETKAAGSAYTMTAANTTFTAQWHELDCKIYSFTGGIGSAAVEAGDAAVNEGVSLVMTGSSGIIKLTPASGETFKAGDVFTISGTVGNTSKNFGVKISGTNDKKSTLGLASVAGTSNPMIATATLSADADYLYICRDGGTTQTLKTVEVHRSCAEGTAAGLSYATAEVNKTEGGAKFTNELTNANGLILAGYKSSNPEIATVDFTTGEVTIVGVGSAIISVNSAVQTKAGTLYAAGIATYTLNVAALPKYTVTYDLNGGSGTPSEVDHKANEKFNLHDGITGITAPANKTFVNWKDQDDALFDGGAEYTMPAKNVTLTAQWAGDVYTVKYMDGETLLDTKVVEVGQHPVDITHPTKALYSFASWQLSGSDVVLDDVNGTKDAEITLTARWAKAYATSYDMEAYAVSDGASKSGLETALTAAGYAYTNINGIDNGHTHNYTYDGMKYKTNDGDLSFNVVAGKVVEVKTGHLPTNDAVTMYINGVADATVFEGADENIETHKTNYFYSAAEALYRLDVKASKGTCAVKAVTIRDPYQVTFNVDGGDPVSAQYGHPSITLPSASKGTDSFLGWFIGEDKIGEAGDSYTPTANVELVAHWEAVSSDARLSSITFSSAAGTLSPAFDPEVVNYTYTMPYGTAAIPTITGATSVNANAQDPIIGEAATAWGGSQTIKGVAQSGDKKTYTITMAKAPKDGVCLIKGNVGNNTFVIDEEASLLSGTPSKNNVKSESSTYETLTGWKFNSRPAHLGLTLSEGTFQEGDVVEVFVTSEANGGGTTHKMRVFDAADATPAHVLAESAADMVQGANRLVLPATSTSSLYLHRGASGADYENWNPYVAYFAVYRPMNPMLTAMTIDGRTVTINEDAKTATVTIPYESDLANLTIAKTIVWNAPAAENSIVVNGGSAWVIGENTYKLTDKDGDATTYTITVARDVLKHTVSFNTHGGSAVASVEVEHNANLTAVPNDPSKEDYIFQYWSLTDGGEEVDVTTVQINEDKEFHAVWVSDGGIKLLDGSTVNHTNFITAVTATETVEFKGNTVNYAKFSGTCSGVSSVKDLTRVIAYNATTNKTKIRISAHNNSTSGRNILVKGLVEGASAAVDLATIALGNKEDKVSDWIEFDNAANRTIYIMVGSSAGDVYFTQVKVIESGETPMKQVGEAGYALNMNKGRFFGLANTDLAFEGLNARLSGDYTALNSGYAKLASTSMSFTVASDMNLVVTTNNSKTYYVTKGAAGTDNETAKKGVSEFDLTAGTWYITAGSDEVQFTNIAFELPKAAKPVVADLANVEYCQGSAIDELAVSATVSDGGTMLYQWYKDGEIIAGAEAETYQPTADGEYYVVVVNTKTGYQNSDAVQSNTITVTGYAATVLSGTTGAENWPGEDATISVTASGKNLHYAWYTCDDAMGANPVAVDPAVDAAELNVTIAAADTYYKVVVSGDCGSAQEAVITVVARQAVELQDVTGDMSWDFSKANDGSAAGSDLCIDEVLANVHGIVNNDDFKSAYLKATANKFKSGKLQASMIKFHTTVDGMITVVFSNTGNKSQDRYLTVNGRKTDKGTKTETAVTYTGFVYAGDVELGVVEGDGNMLNFTSVQFTATTSYTRPVNPSFLGTLCWTNNAVLGGATLYVFAGKNENNYLVFDEVEENRLEAGKPYIFMPENGNTEIKLYNTDNEAALTEDQAPVNNMYGTITGKTLLPGVDDNMYYFSSNHIWAVKDFAVNIPVPAYYCYVDYAAVLAAEPAPAPAPGRRRVTMGVKGEQVATGIGEVQGDKVQSTKVLIDGHIYILRGEKLYDATGRLVK